MKTEGEVKAEIPNWPTGRELICALGADECVLQFSGGKDSLGCWLHLRDKLAITPIYRYLIPDLEFVEESLAYYEAFFGAKIHRLPHPSLYRMLNNLVFQPPERCSVIEAAELRDIKYDSETKRFCESIGKPKLWSANGTRMADSLFRRKFFAKHSPINRRTMMFYPIWDWRVAGLKAIMLRTGCRLPIDYDLFGISFDGIDFRFLAPIKKHFPRDYARILDFFPLADLELYRHEQHLRHQSA